MTIAISLKVNDGLVLAADSASTLIGTPPAGQPTVLNVYNNANKVFNLRKGVAVGAITWGAGNIGQASISTLTKDLRRRFAGDDPAWELDPEAFTVLGVAERLRAFMFEEQYQPAFDGHPNPPVLGFIVAGYSAGAPMAEEYLISMSGAGCEEPTPVRQPHECGVTWNGEVEAITRLLLGFGTGLPNVLAQRLGVPADQIVPAMGIVQQELQLSLVQDAMPFQDAIDLAIFLVHTSIQYSRFNVGAATVGGPIEVAAVSKHEGFKWIRRKHYYGSELNPPM